jgi:hypothetical protein
MSQTFIDWCFDILRGIVQAFSRGSRPDASSDRHSGPHAIAVPQAQSVVININTSAPTVTPPPTAAQGPSAPAQIPPAEVESKG